MNKPTYKFYKKKLNILLKDKSHFFFTGFLVVIILTAVSIYQLKNNKILGVFTFDSSEASAIALSDKTNDVLKVVADKSINYVSPITNAAQNMSSFTGLSRPEEHGQISAISTSRVTNTSKTYVVKEGDSLQTIAEEVYGDPNAWERIVKANNLDSPDNIEVGMTLTIPR